MNKEEFLNGLKNGLSGLPENDVSERLEFYSEMIDDRIEEGMTEEEAVGSVGKVEDAVAQAVSETPLTRIIKEKIAPARSSKGWKTALIILGSPLWVPLLIALFAVILALYVSVWAIVISLWAVTVSLFAVSLASVAFSVLHFIRGDVIPGIAAFGSGLLCAGLAIFMCFGCKAATKGVIKLSSKITLRIKRRFVGKEITK